MIKKDKTITVLCGGDSSERDISLMSGKNVATALKALGYTVELCDPSGVDMQHKIIDIAFIALHGLGYEDGQLQQLLEKRNIPYTGSGILASKIGMNKQLTKTLCQQHDIAIPAYKTLTKPLSKLPPNFSFPVIIKPLNEGSSLNVYIIDNEEQLQEKTTNLIQVYNDYFLEEFIEGKELSVGVLQDQQCEVFPILELVPKNRFYDFEAKYTKGMTKFIIPAQINEQETKKVQAIAKKIYKLAQCNGAIRVDFRWCPQKGPFVLEFNTVPGLTQTSDLPAQAKAKGWSFETLIEKILMSAKTNK